ncbi:hypothetical protein JCM9533A_38100 [Catenuloplanes niger JCM 9533]
MSRRISSPGPSRFTMILGSETVILVCARAFPGVGVPVIVRPAGLRHLLPILVPHPDGAAGE